MTNQSTAGRTARYTLVGGICAVSYNAIMIFGSKAGGDYVSLSVLAYLVVVPVGYLLHARFTFRTRLSWQEFVRFALAVAASFPVYFCVIAALCSGLRLNIAVAAPLATIAMYCWNYASTHWALRWWVPVGRHAVRHDKMGKEDP